jgi:hypothetical protein
MEINFRTVSVNGQGHEYGPVHVQGHARIRASPCTWTGSNMALSMYRDRPEFEHVPVQGHSHIRPCPCTGTGPNSGMSLYMDRAEYDPVKTLNLQKLKLKY